MKFSRALIVVPVASLLVSACGAGRLSPRAVLDPPAPTSAPSAVPAGYGSRADDGVFPRSVRHFGGTTEITAEPRRVVAIATGQLDGLLTLGVTPLGTARGDGAGLVPDYLRSTYPDANISRIADVGLRLEPDLEKIAALEPDLILANQAAGSDLYDRYSQIAPTVYTEGEGVNWKSDFLMIGHAVGKADAAQKLLDRHHQGAAELAQARSSNPTVSFVRLSGDRARVFGIPSFSGSIAADLGLPRPTSQQFDETSADITEEQAERADGDVIFLGTQDGADTSLLRSPLWRSLAAVKDGRLVKVDDDAWFLNAGPTAADIVMRQVGEAVGS